MYVFDLIWRKSEMMQVRYGVNPIVFMLLYISLYVWVPVAAYLMLPIVIASFIGLILYFAPFGYVIWCGGKKVIKRHFNLVQTKRFEQIDISWEELARWFGEFWASNFWGEHLRCNHCSTNGSMYDKVGTYTRSAAKKLGLKHRGSCPKCGVGMLEYYWNPVTTRQYVQDMYEKSGYEGYTLWVKGKIAAWMFFYDANGLYYVDTIAILPQFRGTKMRWYFLFYFWLQLFRAWRKGYKHSIFRTHRKAKHVMRLAELYSFKLSDELDPRDQDRVYCKARLNVFTLVKSLFFIALLGIRDNIRSQES